MGVGLGLISDQWEQAVVIAVDAKLKKCKESEKM